MSLVAHFHLNYPTTGTDFSRRHRGLQRVDRELSRGNHEAALHFVKQLKKIPGGLPSFGTVKQVPKKLSSLDTLEVNGIRLSSLTPLVDSVIDSIERCIQFALLEQDSVESSENIVHVERSESSCRDDHFMCVQHEAGHFLVGYLLGVLPGGYKIPSIEAMRSNNFAEGRIEFMGFEFLGEVRNNVAVAKRLNTDVNRKADRGKISSKTFNNFSCVILGGLVTEHILFGFSEGLHSDVDKLDSVLRWMGYTKSEADYQLRWATFNTVFLLQRYKEARLKLAEAMASGKSIGSCIDAIENSISMEKPR